MNINLTFDRFGNKRYIGYKKENFQLCPDCVPDGNIKKSKLFIGCKICGGYGEYPKSSKAVLETK